VRLAGIQAGDIVEVDRRGRRFHAVVTDTAAGGLAVEPLDRRISYRSCRAHEVLAHWSKRGRPRVTDEPHDPREMREQRAPSPVQLVLDTISD
jgi:hypothetical protein